MKIKWQLFAFSILLLASSVLAQEIKIAAAADLVYVMKDITSRFEKESGIKVSLSTGSSGNFFSQIQSGAPYDLFFSADIGYPQKLEAAGFTEPDSLYQYAVGKIVLWVPRGSDLDLGNGFEALLNPSVKKIAIANPQHAPYGRAAVAALRSAGIYDKVAGKLVFGENISQTAQFVSSGNAEAGIIALSLAMAPMVKNEGRYWTIPAKLYPPLEQGAVILKSSRNKQAARRFMEFIKKPEMVAILQSYGFAAPQSKTISAAEKNKQ